MQINILQITDAQQKQRIARAIMEALPGWFENREAIDRYVAECVEHPFLAALREADAVGFLCLKETGDATVELAVMGVLPEYHRRGIGRALFRAARDISVDMGYVYMQVKTVRMGFYPEYDQTNRFYQAMGFREFECFPMLWDDLNPCQIYVLAI